jgi:membrane glycosyltransferase
MSAPLDLLLEDWPGALERARAYLAALGALPDARERLARAALDRAAGRLDGGKQGAVPETMAALEEILLEVYPLAGPPAATAERFALWRRAAFRAGGPRPGVPLEALPLDPAPPLVRASMVPERIGRRRFGGLGRRRGRAPAQRPSASARLSEPRPVWRAAAWRRRALLLALVLVPSVLAGSYMLDILPHQGRSALEPVIAGLFGALFGWISIGSWTAVFGFGVLARRGDRFAVCQLPDGAGPLDRDARVALLMPICEEPVERVFAGLRAIRDSLARAGALDHFDLFVLSDSRDPRTQVAEEWAWAEWRRSGAERVYYRRRRVRRKRKSGNVADFCRRWGRLYRYLVVLDADSLMTGETLLRLVRCMEQNPRVGIVQTAPIIVGARSLFARLQQFANRLYGPLFAAGIHFWKLGDGPYWGHNAILRTAPFMKHCGLPRLTGPPPLGGDILSHDFVEAALLGRAGYETWLAHDLGGSWEETPASLLEELQRDRRWCQGNLQHLRLLLTQGLSAAHRVLFLNGIFSYVSGLLWLALLAAGTGEAVLRTLRPPDYFPSGMSLFPSWPVWRPQRALWLLAATVFLLFLPKVLALLLALWRGEARGFGGAARLLRSSALEILASTLLAPVRMVFHCSFVLQSLFGRAAPWRSGEADGGETSWREALRRHGPATAAAVAWGSGVLALAPEYLPWLAPVLAALFVAAPLSVVASRARAGDWARRHGWLCVPEETQPPAEVAQVERALQVDERARAAAAGFESAVLHPYVNAVHTALARRSRSLPAAEQARRRALAEAALAGGPGALTAAEQQALLADADCLAQLHRDVWGLADPTRAAHWGLAEPAP